MRADPAVVGTGWSIINTILFTLLKPKSRHCGVGAHQRQGKREKGNEKSEEKKRDRGTEGESSTPAWVTDALRGEKEQRRKQGVGPQPGYPWTFGRLLRPVWIIWWSYSETLPTNRGKYNKWTMFLHRYFSRWNNLKAHFPHDLTIKAWNFGPHFIQNAFSLSVFTYFLFYVRCYIFVLNIPVIL